MNIELLSEWLAEKTEQEARCHLSWRPKNNPEHCAVLDRIDADIRVEFGQKIYEVLK